MPKVPAHATVVNRPTDRTHPLSLLNRGLMILIGALVVLATTGAAVSPNASRLELMMYSYGSALAIITAIKIIIVLRVYLIKAAFLLAIVGSLYVAVRMIVNVVGG
jgi:hypothetical protein